MGYNWEKGLVGAGTGFLSGYSTILSAKSKEQLEQKRQDALFQREKNMAKYKNDMAVTNKQEDRAYSESQRPSGFMKGDKEITQAEHDSMEPEAKAGLTSKSDYQIGLAERKATTAFDTQKKLTEGAQKEAIDNTLSYYSQKEGWDETQMGKAREFMIAQGITKPSELQAAIKGVEKSMKPEDVIRIQDNAKKKAQESIKSVMDPLKTAKSMGYKGDDEDQASIYLFEQLSTKYKTESLMEIGRSKGSSSLLDVGKGTPKPGAKEEEGVISDPIQKLASDVQAGNVTLEEIYKRKPDLYKEVIKIVGKGGQPSSMTTQLGGFKGPSLFDRLTEGAQNKGKDIKRNLEGSRGDAAQTRSASSSMLLNPAGSKYNKPRPQ